MAIHDDTSTGSKLVAVADLLGRIGTGDPSLRIIDARPAAQYRAGHLPGAVNLDVSLLPIPSSDEGAVREAIGRIRDAFGAVGIRPTDHAVAYEDFSGVAAARAVWLLDLLGVALAALLDGGLSAWLEAGGEVSRTLPELGPRPFDAVPRLDLLATRFDLVPAISADSAAIRVLDTRGALEHRMGTIPTAVHLDWVRNLAPDGRFLPRAELAAMYREAGLDPEDGRPVVAFCGSGFRAAHSYLALKELGFADVRNYAPSWHEWGGDAELPIERGRG